jgi:hypothetical protein
VKRKKPRVVYKNILKELCWAISCVQCVASRRHIAPLSYYHEQLIRKLPMTLYQKQRGGTVLGQYSLSADD